MQQKSELIVCVAVGGGGEECAQLAGPIWGGGNGRGGPKGIQCGAPLGVPKGESEPRNSKGETDERREDR